LVKGGDYLPENIIGKEFVKQVITIPLLEGFSTTQIISKNN
jgi:D-beta-D-heptose 7-phosphate kinase/D-beta-D-heptose 1-phosphate adenosyltransferase